MTKRKSTSAVEDVLRRLEESRMSLIQTLESADPQRFEQGEPGTDSIRHHLQRATDDVNFYYGRLVARALNLPQPPCLTRADFGSLREGVMALQVAHRRFTNLLHDLTPGDLEKAATDPELGSYTLRQVLEMAIAQYTMRAGQVRRLADLTPIEQPE